MFFLGFIKQEKSNEINILLLYKCNQEMYICQRNYMRPIIHKTKRLNIPISEAEPVRVSNMSYPNRKEAHYDMHFGLELGIVLSGVMRRYYQGHCRLVGRGQAWFCGMWEPHGCKIVNAPCACIVIIIWPPLLAQQRFEEAPDLKWMAPFTIRPADRPQIASSKRKIFLEQAAQLSGLTAPLTPLEKIRIRLCLLNILTLALESCPERKIETDNPGHEHWVQLNRAVQLVFGSRTFISTGRAAKECGLNRNIFSQLFEKWMGIRFADFALRFRLKQAAGQILNGNDPVKAVAQNWGFTDTSHFHRVFTKHYGRSPSEFRQQH